MITDENQFSSPRDSVKGNFYHDKKPAQAKNLFLNHVIRATYANDENEF